MGSATSVRRHAAGRGGGLRPRRQRRRTIAAGDFTWVEITRGTRLAYTDGIFPGRRRVR